MAPLAGEWKCLSMGRALCEVLFQPPQVLDLPTLDDAGSVLTPAPPDLELVRLLPLHRPHLARRQGWIHRIWNDDDSDDSVTDFCQIFTSLRWQLLNKFKSIAVLAS